ncbi:MAG: right-handed parallel beta-helix repeat-containing protein [Chitinophagales bacterium]|nr:right-handed parallel beta-helix repeat-containing protein [Chitinophagales bacterium]
MLTFNSPFTRSTLVAMLLITLSFSMQAQDAYVNPSGSCAGAPCFTNISDAILAASPGDVIEVEDGIYNENITIDKALTLQSANGFASTSIQGSDVALGTVTISPTTSDVTIDGFTIIGFDGANPGLEKAAVYLQGAVTNITIQNNEIVANGEAGLLSEYNAAIDNIVIDNNIFSGQTFVGSTPGGCGFGTQFVEPNVPRQLVVIGGGPNVSNSMNVTFTNNHITGTAGAPKAGCNPPFDYQGNTLVTIDVINASITGNIFEGETGRFATALRVRGTNTTIDGNTFIGDNLALAATYIFTDEDALAGATPSTLAEVIASNLFSPESIISGPGIYPCLPLTPPAPWLLNDIGNSGLGNTASYEACEEVFTIASGGNNLISTTSDNVAFLSQYLCGNDITITAKVENLTPNGYGGLMIRETGDANSKQVAIFSNLSNSLRHETRYLAGANKVVQNFVKPSPVWLRLQRQGNWVFAFYSTNGTFFQYVHAVYVPLNNCIEIGLASFTYLPNTQTEATFSNVEVTGGEMMPYIEAPEIVEATTIKQTNNLYPNPASDIVNLVFEDGLNKNVTVILHDQIGRVIEQRELGEGEFTTDWDVSMLIDGLYFFEIHKEGEAMQVLRLVKTQ